jgi:nicotinate phosphoribosyltransferase
MAQGFLLGGRKDATACFDYFFRKNPFHGGYVIFAGLADLLDTIEGMRFADEDCAYLASIGFAAEFVEYLAGFEFRGEIHAPPEGEIVFPYEPVVRVEGTIIETQIIETMLLNILNFESLIATKAARIRQAAGGRLLIDFGFRRAHGAGALAASRAAVIGGLNSTSNVYSAFKYGLSPAGTQAHSWIEVHDDELTAFRNFAKVFPKKCVLLVDTYDTLLSGVPNAIIVAQEMEARGERLFGVRLDSGDLAYLSKKTRSMLDKAGLGYVRIMASNQLDEYLIRSLLEQGAPLDAFGVGTKLATGLPDAALDGVYKLSVYDSRPRLKISENPEKIILPGYKRVFRCLDDNGRFVADGITLDDEGSVDIIFHPHRPDKSSSVGAYKKEPLFAKVMEKGRVVMDRKKIPESADYARARLEQLPEEHKRFENPHIYRVGISSRLMDLRTGLLDAIRSRYFGKGGEHEGTAGH